MGMAFASGAHTYMVVNNSQTSANSLVGTRRTHMCETLQDRTMEENPNQWQPVLLQLIRWGIEGTLH